MKTRASESCGHRVGHAVEVEVLEETRPEPLRIDVADRRQQPQDELLLAHLEAEDADRATVADGGVLGDIQREARLADRWSGREDDEVALLEPCRQGVQLGEAGPDAADLASMGVQIVEPIERLMEQ